MRNWIPDRYRELRSLVKRDSIDEDVGEELEHHIAMRTEENIAAGMSPEEARAAALRRFGDVERFRRETREIDRRMRRRRWRGATWQALGRELRQSLRLLRRHPSFAAIAGLTLALGIGAFTSIFAVLDSVVLRPLPYPDSERLVWLDSPVPGVAPEAVWGLSVAGYFYLKDENRTFGALGAYSRTRTNLAGVGGVARVDVAAVTAGVLDALRARPQLGRSIVDEDDDPGAERVAVLAHEFWTREYGADPEVLGRTIELDAVAYRVVGVMEPGFRLLDDPFDAWIPLQLDRDARPVNAHWLSGVGRLRDGVSLEEAQADLARLTGQFSEVFPGAYQESFMRGAGFTTRVTPLRARVVGDIDRVLWILFASVGLVLLIAGANVTNLFLVRSETRRRELALRSALGAERLHIAWHYFTESLVLCLGAGVLAFGLAYGALELLLALAPPELPRLTEIELDPRAILFSGGVALGAAAFLALFPLGRRLDYEALRESGRGMTASRRRHAIRHGIVVGQIALALVLLVAAGLMLRSFQRLREVNPGFEAANVLTFEVALPTARYGSYEEVVGFYRALLAGIEGLPGVRQAGATEALPLQDRHACALVFVEERPPEPDKKYPCIPKALVSPGYFGALGIPLLTGRELEWGDVERRTGAVVVTRALADRMWPGADPLGKGIRPNGWGEPFYRVVGVTDDLRADGFDRPPIEAVYFPPLPLEGAPLWSPPRRMAVAVKTQTANPTSLTPAIRRVLAELDPDVPLANLKTMGRVVSDSPSMLRTSFLMSLLGIAGGLALTLSVVGLYGVVSYVVRQREGEIGVRMALGARVEQVVGMILKGSLRLALIGVALGVLAALALSRLLSSLLFDVSPTDPVTLIGVSLLLLALSLAASYKPASRAARVDPTETLRVE
ncbi:MAG: ABC transporter permease [Gemmatimonadetes bacterium]|uniref:ABC transporter permease n=1 Tax=Candidatus Kutchimonas denitrificans TaxID=3056748 RepID=A0AAE4Z8Q5_9BACT|nr:ABC transporter permease [Gemmatimonadota bacterium]NIR75073.1 ABC transporter permease [Candidatus Kutchimonas denitrificans]NIS02893.1 ABC transporter permease [Gemmatimonadota bacterium]NIT68602.1 ABC transporter permease [Gemmatimonadota bacterium]NIU52862.1 FtsX-like permease family protein [Gemmatimonadota bacterium]